MKPGRILRSYVLKIEANPGKAESLYTMLSERGNPVLSSLYAILDTLDLRLSVVRKEAA